MRIKFSIIVTSFTDAAALELFCREKNIRYSFLLEEGEENLKVQKIVSPIEIAIPKIKERKVKNEKRIIELIYLSIATLSTNHTQEDIVNDVMSHENIVRQDVYDTLKKYTGNRWKYKIGKGGKKTYVTGV